MGGYSTPLCWTRHSFVLMGWNPREKEIINADEIVEKVNDNEVYTEITFDLDVVRLYLMIKLMLTKRCYRYL